MKIVNLFLNCKPKTVIMKKSLIALVAISMMLTVQAQRTTGKLKDQKDVWGTTYTYSGEIKNGKPDGFGVAAYNNGYK